MRFIGTLFVFALLATAPLASAQKAIDITPYYIAGIQLGMTKAKALSYMTKPLRHDMLEDGYERYVSPRQKVEVYFRKGTTGVAVVTTWNRQLQTDEQIGPCSTLAALKHAYGAKLTPFRQSSKTYAYRLGNLVFTIAGARVGAVAVGRGPGAAYVALNVAPCR
jgi:hypothetical protein